jgi:hypothetical protein
MKKMLLCVVFAAVACCAQEEAYAENPQKAVPAAQQSGRADAVPVTALDVIEMSRAGLGASVMVSKIESSGASFDLSVADIIGLKKEGVPDQVINCMINTKNAPRGRAVSSVPKAAVVSYAAPAVPVYYAAPAPAYVVRDYYYEPPVSFSFSYSNAWGGPYWRRGGWGWGYGPRRRWCW